MAGEAMKEHPILFSAPMVRAILEGKKTQTRRILKPQPSSCHWNCLPGYRLNCKLMPTTKGLSARFQHTIPQNESDPQWIDCRYGVPGAHLWVRETFAPCLSEPYQKGCLLLYRTDKLPVFDKLKWKPSIHMPRWASRITLEIVNIRVERLQEIDAADCYREGLVGEPFPVDKFKWLWDSINGKKYSWASNPWVWVIEFKTATINRKEFL